MNCEKCGFAMVIDEWNGWVWTCFHCDAIGGEATDEEVEANHQLNFKRRHSGFFKGD